MATGSVNILSVDFESFYKEKHIIKVQWFIERIIKNHWKKINDFLKVSSKTVGKINDLLYLLLFGAAAGLKSNTWSQTPTCCQQQPALLAHCIKHAAIDPWLVVSPELWGSLNILSVEFEWFWKENLYESKVALGFGTHWLASFSHHHRPRCFSIPWTIIQVRPSIS